MIATAPAAFGEHSVSYDSWHYTATSFYPLLEKMRSARVMLFYFRGDDFDPGGRGERSRDILAERRLVYVVIDQPPHLTSHWAAATPHFARLYGACILAFVEATHLDLQAQCNAGTFWAAANDGPGQLAARLSR